MTSFSRLLQILASRPRAWNAKETDFIQITKELGLGYVNLIGEKKKKKKKSPTFTLCGKLPKCRSYRVWPKINLDFSRFEICV